MTGSHTGRLEVICGPMFSGKSEELLRRLRRAEIAGHKVVVVKPTIDHRYSQKEVVSHAGSKMPALVVNEISDLRFETVGYDVVGIDEVQFFDGKNSFSSGHEDFLIETLLTMSKRQLVIVSGLDMTYRGEPFGSMPTLMAVADRVEKLNAVCHSCGQDAMMTQRLVDGKPAPFTGPTIEVGGIETYEARCRNCYQKA